MSRKRPNINWNRRAVETLHALRGGADVFKPLGFLCASVDGSTHRIAFTTATILTANKVARWKAVERGHLLVLTRKGKTLNLRTLMIENGMDPVIRQQEIFA